MAMIHVKLVNFSSFFMTKIFPNWSLGLFRRKKCHATKATVRLRDSLLGACFRKFKKSQKIWVFLQQYKLCMDFDKKWVGLHFGRFFPNSSGHPSYCRKE
jgi:hypothetical protein